MVVSPKTLIGNRLKKILINISFLILSSLFVSSSKKEQTLYRWGTFSSWEWKTVGDKKT